MTQDLILSLDLGTTGNRAIAFNKQGKIVASSYYEFTQHFPQPGWVEHDAEEIWATTKRAYDDVIQEVGQARVAAIGITNQRETTVVWDRRTGKPVHNAIVWQCRRTAPRCKELASHAPEIKAKTGLLLDAYFSATKLEWLLKDRDSEHLLFGTIDSWIVWNLTDGQSHITDASNASRTMLYNIHTGWYDEDLLALFNVPSHILPEVVDSTGFLAKTTDGIPITGIIGDQQAALFTQCGDRTDLIKNTYGTGLFVVTNTGQDIIEAPRLVSTVAWQQDGQQHYALEGSIFVGGSAIQWLRDGLQLISKASESEALACSLEDNEGVYFVPALVGLGAPYWDSDARGLFTGLTRGTTKAHFCRAALESLAYQTRDVMDEILRAQSSPYTALRVDGGAVSNAFLMQFQSDILGTPVERPRVTETTAFGAAGMAGMAVGFWSKDEFLSLNTIEQRFEPIMDAKLRERYYFGWQKAVKKVLD